MDAPTYKPWTGVDLDGTLAHHAPGAYDPTHIGLPIQPMLNRVRAWLAEGKTVKLFTARASQPEAVKACRAWLDNLGLQAIEEITATKDYQMEELWDDRSVGVVFNRGIPVEAMVAHEFLSVLKAADVPVETGQSYADAGRIAATKVRGAITKLDSVRALVDAAADAMDYVKTDALAKLELTGDAAKTVASLIADIERAKRAMKKANAALKP